jgi:hypothetical protein
MTTSSSGIETTDGHTSFTHAHRPSVDPKPYCNECEQHLMVWHLLWKCRNFNTQPTKNNITTETLKDDKQEAVNFLRDTGLIYPDLNYDHNEQTQRNENTNNRKHIMKI